MKKKILLSGINGFLGSVFASRLKQKNFDVLCPVKLQLDVSKKNDWQTFLKHNDFDFILHFAGCKDVKKLEDDFGFAVEQNAKWVKNLDYAIENVEKKKVKCLFFSSDYVFDALEGKCSENTPPKSKTGRRSAAK